MANINITVQSLLNSALYEAYTVDNGITVNDLKTTIMADTGVDTSWFVLAFDNEELVGTNTLASYNIINDSVLTSGNVIARLPTLQDRQLAKLDLAVLDRIYDGNPFHTYDINLLPSQYIGNVSTPNIHTYGLVQGRPWVIPSPPPPPPLSMLYLDASNKNSYNGSGNTWYDISGNLYNATLINDPTYNILPKSIEFDPASLQWAEAPDIGSLSVWTVESWFYLTASLTGQITAIVCNQFDGVSSLNFSMGTNNSPGSYNLTVGFFDGTWHSTTGFAPDVDTWYHCVGTYDGSTINQYINGALLNSLSYSGTPTSGGNIRIASRWDDQTSTTDFFPGKISLVRIYNVALTDYEAYQTFVNTAPKYLPSITFDFTAFGDGPYVPGNQIEDFSGSFNPTTGFAISEGVTNGSGVTFINLTQEQKDFFAASAYNNGYIWYVTWAEGSTYINTPVALYMPDPDSIAFWILDPTDLTYSNAITNGIFDFPAIFTEGTIPTSFTN